MIVTLQILTLIVASFVAYIGFEQMRINRQRLKRELFDPRLDQYKAALDLIGKGGFHSREFSDEWLTEFRTITVSGRFLLEEPAIQQLKHLDTKAQELLAINDELNDEPGQARRNELAKNRRELAVWFREQYSLIDEAFDSSLNLNEAIRFLNFK